MQLSCPCPPSPPQLLDFGFVIRSIFRRSLDLETNARSWDLNVNLCRQISYKPSSTPVHTARTCKLDLYVTLKLKRININQTSGSVSPWKKEIAGK